MALATGFLFALVVTAGLAPLWLLMLWMSGALDRPSARSSHARPTLRGGGLAIVFGSLTGLLETNANGGSAIKGLVVAALAFGVIGLADDLRGVPPLARLAVQAGAAAPPPP